MSGDARGWIVWTLDLLAAAAVALPVASPCQESAPGGPMRSPVFGSAVDRAGEAWPGARITLVGRPFPQIEAVGDLDRIQVDADAEGRFRAALLPDRSYSAWAISAAADSPLEFRMSDVAEGVVTGLGLQLRESPQTHGRRAVRVLGREAHADAGPLCVEAVAGCETLLRIPLPEEQDGHFVCPPMPLARITIRDARGVPLLLDIPVPVDRRNTPAADTLELPPPTVVLVRAVDASRVPIAGARVVLQEHTVLHPLGITDVDGKCSLRLPGGFSRTTLRTGALVLRVDAVGFGAELFPGSRTAEPDPQVQAMENLTFRLAPCGVVSGRLLPRPAAPCPLIQLTGRQPLVVCTDPDGRFSLAVTADQPFALWTAVPGTAHKIPGPTSWQRALLASGSSPVDLGDLHLAELRPLGLQVRMPDGSPAERPPVWIGQEPGIHAGQLLHADRLGRLSFLIDPRQASVVAAVCGEAAGAITVAGDAGAGARKEILALKPLLSIAGRVTDEDGVPLAGFAVSQWCTSPRRASGDQLIARLLPGRSVKTDGEGRFRLLLPFRDDEFELRSAGLLGSIRAEGIVRVQVADRPVTDVRIRVDGRLPRK